MSWIDRVIKERANLIDDIGALDAFLKRKADDPDADRTHLLLLGAQKGAMAAYLACLDARLKYMGVTVDSYETIWGVPNDQG